MKTLYFECNMGAAGDMLMAALLELHNDSLEFLNRLNRIGIPNAHVSAQRSVKCGITGTHVRVAIDGHEEGSYHHEHAHGGHEHHHEHEHEHTHNSYHEIEHLIGHLNVSDNVKKNALEVYKLIAEAESRAHGVPVDKIHFHEVGETDAVVDIAGVCMLIEELAPDAILASPVNTGSGHVRCAHGILPVPAPATAYILHNVPMYSDQTQGELCTPTGAALLKHFVREFRPMPLISVTATGYGMGQKDFDKANCVRAFIGNSAEEDEAVTELVCNLDDMTAEALAFAQRLLFEEGALEVYTTPVCMKKGRMGQLLTCMCPCALKDTMISLIFKHTTTLGIREHISRRYTLHREQAEVQTKYGTVRVKNACGYGVKKSKYEYEDIAGIAQERGMSIQEVLDGIGLTGAATPNPD